MSKAFIQSVSPVESRSIWTKDHTSKYLKTLKSIFKNLDKQNQDYLHIHSITSGKSANVFIGNLEESTLYNELKSVAVPEPLSGLTKETNHLYI